MVPTRRLLLLGLLPALPLALATWLSPMLLVALAAGLLALVVAAADWRLTPAGRLLDAGRRHEPKLSLGADNAVEVEVRNAGPLPLLVRLRDEPPPSFVDAPVFLTLRVPAAGAAVARYHVRPRERGQFCFGPITLRYPSPLGLWLRQLTLRPSGEVRVYPNLQELRKYDLLARRGLLTEIGLRNARRLGEGNEFERLREYLPDDEFRRIDWKATARRHKPIARQYETERSQNLILMVDAGRLMGVQIERLSKLDHVVNTVLMLGYVAILRGDRVGLVAFADSVLTYQPPRRGRRAFFGLLERLYNLHWQPVEPDFGVAFDYLAARNLSRALVVCFTDLSGRAASDAVVRHVAALAHRHLVVTVTVSDPNLLRLAGQTATDSQGLYEKAVAQRLLLERQELLGWLRQRGAIALDLPTERLTAAVVNQYLELKARSRI